LTAQPAWNEDLRVIQQPLAQFAYLAAVAAFVFQVARARALRPLFDKLPPLVWTYVLPMLSTTAGVLPAESPLYGAMTRYLLPASLVLLLLSSDLPSIARLGRVALLTMTAGCVGMALGASIGYLLLRPWLPPDAWKAAGALAATWTGGSANLLAVATTLQADPGVVIIVDTVVGYSWMALLIWLASRQHHVDAWNRADRSVVDAVSARLGERTREGARIPTVADLTLMIGLAAVLTAVCLEAGAALPQVGEVLKPFSWAIILITTSSLLLSLTPLARLEGAGASTLGYAGFYLLLTSVGAQGDLRQVFAQPAFVALGIVAILVHALFLLAALRLLRAPLFFFGAASQACLGGYSSAPIVADIYQPGAASIGLLLAVIGNVLGTYLGLFVAQVLSGFAP
jgi:uncharacterized membrane protein